MRTLLGSVLVVGSVLVAAPASAVPSTTTFDGFAPQMSCQGSLATGGLSMALTGSGCIGVWPINPVSSNGTPALIYGYAGLELSATGGGDFYLDSFLAGISWYSLQPTATIHYSFDLSGGGTLDGSFVLGRGLAAYSFGHWVSEARFTGLSDGYVAIDDLVADPNPAAVPEPATWAMLAAGLGFARRRRIKRAAR